MQDHDKTQSPDGRYFTGIAPPVREPSQSDHANRDLLADAYRRGLRVANIRSFRFKSLDFLFGR